MKADRVTERRKLIEVALPLEAINREAAREKSIRHGHPSTLHLWWARRPLAAARAVLFAQLVDDPDSRPEAEAISDPDERAAWVSAERTRLFRLIEELVKWENSNDERVLSEARAEIMRSTDGKPPAILDPFAGGGTIPLEAQRLGLEAHASDLNPVAVLINKALIEIPPKFAGRHPVFPGAAESKMGAWPRATGLAEDVRRYGQWMRDEAERRIGHLYPPAILPDRSTAKVIAWIWARTVTCPNPACGIDMPLVRSWWLGKKKGREAYVIPEVVRGSVRYDIGRDAKRGPTGLRDGTIVRGSATCVSCGNAADSTYLKSEAKAGRFDRSLIAIVASGTGGRQYLPPTTAHEVAADLAADLIPADVPTQLVTTPCHDVDRLPMYGMPRWCDAFTDRQLVVLTTLSGLVGEARDHVLRDALAAGWAEGCRLVDDGNDAAAYADGVATGLGLAVSRTADLNNSLVTWSNGRDQARNLFARQAIPMAWDYVEVSPFGDAAGDIGISVRTAGEAIEGLGGGIVGRVEQANPGSTDDLGG